LPADHEFLDRSTKTSGIILDRTRRRTSMGRNLAVLAITLTAFVQAGYAQTQTAAEPDPGVKPIRLIDRSEVRVTRVELRAGATRRAHTHDDVVYHLWVPIEGQLQLTVAAEAPVAATSGQAFFFKRGTPHGFKNVGTTPAAVLEIFVKQTTTPGGQASLDDLVPGLAALLQAPRRLE
jgi:quercetin dioxygenase-like cupin family protein